MIYQFTLWAGRLAQLMLAALVDKVLLLIRPRKKILPPSKDTLHINFLAKKASGKLTIYNFMDNGHFIAYVPSLNLSSYGDNKKEAYHRLIMDVIDDFLTNLTVLPQDQANKELEKLGWTRSEYFKKRFTSNSYVDRNGVLKNFNLPEETQIQTRVVTV